MALNWTRQPPQNPLALLTAVLGRASVLLDGAKMGGNVWITGLITFVSARRDIAAEIVMKVK